MSGSGKKSPLWILAQVAVAVAVAWFVWESVAANWTEFRTMNVDLEWDLRYVVAALALVLGTFGILIAAWRGLVGRKAIGFKTAAAVWSLSNLGRYLPGKVWAVAGLAALSKRAGVSALVATGAAVTMQLFVLGTGALLALFAVDSDPDTRMLVLALLGGIVVAVLGLRVVTKYAPRTWLGEYRQPAVSALLIGVLAVTLSWVTYGGALWLLALGMLPDPSLHLAQATGVFASSYILGLIAVFAPGGLGVREAVMIALLLEPLGAGGATAVTIAARLLFTLAEVTLAAMFLGRKDLIIGSNTIE